MRVIKREPTSYALGGFCEYEGPETEPEISKNERLNAKP